MKNSGLFERYIKSSRRFDCHESCKNYSSDLLIAYDYHNKFFKAGYGIVFDKFLIKDYK